jgi:transposase-like protein
MDEDALLNAEDLKPTPKAADDCETAEGRKVKKKLQQDLDNIISTKNPNKTRHARVTVPKLWSSKKKRRAKTARVAVRKLRPQVRPIRPKRPQIRRAMLVLRRPLRVAA